LKRATPDVQANAALALARLGVSETVDVAHYWLETKGVALDLLTAATEILFVFDEPRRHYAFDLLLSRSPTRALDVALHHPSPAVVELGEHIHTFEDAERQNALLRLLSHAGGSGTRYVIEAFQSSPELRSQAAFLLAHSPEPSAHEALRRAVNQPEQRAEALRALILSQAYQNTDAPELNQGLERALTKGSSTERAIARFGLAVRSESQARQ